MRGRSVLFVCLLATAVTFAAGAVVMPAGAVPSRSSALDVGFKWLGTTCVAGPSDTLRARVRVRMIAFNKPTLGDWANQMKVSMRLESRSGFQLQRNWVTQKSNTLIYTRTEVRDFTLTSDNVVKDSDGWYLHTKLTWSRPGLRNIVRDFKAKQVLPCTVNYSPPSTSSVSRE